MNIEYSSTLSAYRSYEGGMEHLTREVHEYVLSDEYLGKKGKAKRLMVGLAKIADVNKELLIQSFVGKVRYKLPALHLNSKLSPFDTERAKIIAAGIVTNVMIDGGVFSLREDVESYQTAQGQKKFRKKLYVLLGGKMTKDLSKGIHLDPGVVEQQSISGWSLTGEQRAFLAEVSSVPYRVWQGCNADLLMKGYTLKEDWNKRVNKHGKKLQEHFLKERRYKEYISHITDNVMRYPKFYLSGKYDDRGRFYYDAAVLEGIRPHGKLWETLMLDAAEPFKLLSEDERVLKHIIYVTLHGRATVDTANVKWTDLDYFAASERDPMAATTEKEFGEAILLNKAATALDDYAADRMSTFMFGYDFTNSGLMMTGLSFHSKEMMKSANLGNHKTVYDSHTEFGKAYGLDLPRNEVKKLHTALLHGGTNKTLLKEIHSVLGEDSFTLDQVIEANEKAYGECVRNITTIADWGTIVAGNQQSVLRWTMPDDFKASSRAHMEGVPVRIYAASARHKEHYNSYVVVSNMPLVEDNNGFPIYDKDTQLDGVSYPVKVKKRGLFANLTHSIDAYVLRCVVSELREHKRPFLLKHDDYIVPPGAQSIVRAAAQEAFGILYDINVYDKALDEIVEHSPYDLIKPHLYMGNAKNTASVSNNFIMP